MADSDIYRVNGRRPSIFPRDDLSYYAINTRLSSPRALFSLSLFFCLSRRTIRAWTFSVARMD